MGTSVYFCYLDKVVLGLGIKCLMKGDLYITNMILCLLLLGANDN